MFAGRRFVLLTAVAAIAWYACILIFWAFQPLTDSIPVGVDYTLKQPKFVSVTVGCKGLFSSESRDGSTLPALKVQPKGSPPLAYQREPCAIVHHQAQMVFAIDTVAEVAVLVGFGWFVVRRRRSSPPGELMIDHLVGLPSN